MHFPENFPTQVPHEQKEGPTSFRPLPEGATQEEMAANYAKHSKKNDPFGPSRGPLDDKVKRQFHKIGQYCPLLSTFTSLNMMKDRWCMPANKKEELQNSKDTVKTYASLVANTSKKRMAIALLPIVGNLLLAGHDIIKAGAKKVAIIASNMISSLKHRG